MVEQSGRGTGLPGICPGRLLTDAARMATPEEPVELRRQAPYKWLRHLARTEGADIFWVFRPAAGRWPQPGGVLTCWRRNQPQASRSSQLSDPYASARILQESGEAISEDLRERMAGVRIESDQFKLRVSDEKGP
jgi:hypothetical protein